MNPACGMLIVFSCSSILSLSAFRVSFSSRSSFFSACWSERFRVLTSDFSKNHSCLFLLHSKWQSSSLMKLLSHPVLLILSPSSFNWVARAIYFSFDKMSQILDLTIVTMPELEARFLSLSGTAKWNMDRTPLGSPSYIHIGKYSVPCNAFINHYSNSCSHFRNKQSLSSFFPPLKSSLSRYRHKNMKSAHF